MGLSATPCVERIKRLEKEGVIRGYTALINPHYLQAGLVGEDRKGGFLKLWDLIVRDSSVIAIHTQSHGKVNLNVFPVYKHLEKSYFIYKDESGKWKIGGPDGLAKRQNTDTVVASSRLLESETP